MDLCNQSTVRRILEENGLAPKKAFGQNFLINPMIPENIAEASAYEPFFYQENYEQQPQRTPYRPLYNFAPTYYLKTHYYNRRMLSLMRENPPTLSSRVPPSPRLEAPYQR